MRDYSLPVKYGSGSVIFSLYYMRSRNGQGRKQFWCVSRLHRTLLYMEQFTQDIVARLYFSLLSENSICMIWKCGLQKSGQQLFRFILTGYATVCVYLFLCMTSADLLSLSYRLTILLRPWTAAAHSLQAVLIVCTDLHAVLRGMKTDTVVAVLKQFGKGKITCKYIISDRQKGPCKSYV